MTADQIQKRARVWIFVMFVVLRRAIDDELADATAA